MARLNWVIAMVEKNALKTISDGILKVRRLDLCRRYNDVIIILYHFVFLLFVCSRLA